MSTTIKSGIVYRFYDYICHIENGTTTGSCTKTYRPEYYVNDSTHGWISVILDGSVYKSEGINKLQPPSDYNNSYVDSVEEITHDEYGAIESIGTKSVEYITYQIPTSGIIRKSDVFKHIYNRLPNSNEKYSLRKLVEDSCLADKTAPHRLRAFLGYDHLLCSGEAENPATVTTFEWVYDEYYENYQCVFESSVIYEWEGLQCVWVTPTYTSTKSYTANNCPSGTSGSYTSTKTATSTISQADADQKAYDAARNDAESKLVCTNMCYPNGQYSHSICENGYLMQYYHDGYCDYYTVSTTTECTGGSDMMIE
jgi:hypothetical protein